MILYGRNKQLSGAPDGTQIVDLNVLRREVGLDSPNRAFILHPDVITSAFGQKVREALSQYCALNCTNKCSAKKIGVDLVTVAVAAIVETQTRGTGQTDFFQNENVQ